MLEKVITRSWANSSKTMGKSKRVVEDPMVVMFEQTKEYQIMSKSELPPALWVKGPFVTYGLLEMVEKYSGD